MKKYLHISAVIFSLGTFGIYIYMNNCPKSQNLFIEHTQNIGDLQAQYLDSLYLYGNNSEILKEVDSLLAISDLKGRPYLIARKVSFLSLSGRLKEAKMFLVEIMKDSNNVFNQIAVYDYYLQSEADSIDIEEMKNLLKSEKHWFPKVSLLNRIGQYYRDVDFDLDSSRYYYIEAALVLKTNPYLTAEHFLCYEALAMLAPSMRRHLEGIMYSNLLCDFTRYLQEPTDLRKARAYLLRANMLFREGDEEGFFLDDQLARNMIDSALHVKEYQQYLKNELIFLYEFPERDTVIDSLLFKLEKSVKSSGQDHFNFKRLKGNILLLRGRYEDAIQYLKPAFDIEMTKTFFNPRDFSNVCFCLKECYLKLNDFNAALNYIDLNEKYIGGRKDSSLKKNLFYFTNDLERAKIYFEKYELNGNHKDIYKALDYLVTVDQKMIDEYKVTDEQSILQFYLESGVSFLNLGMEATYQLYVLTKDKKYAQQFLSYSDKKKSSLMYRDKQMTTLSHEKSNTENEKLIQLNATIKEEMLNGYRGNARFNLAVQKYMDIEAKLLKKKGKYVGKDDLGALTVANIREVQKKLDDNEVILDISQNGNDIYYLFIKNESLELKKISLSDSDLNTADRYLSGMQKKAKPGLLSDTLDSILLPNLVQTSLKKNVTIIPDGIFHQLALSSLLGEKYNVSYLPALKFKEKEKNSENKSGTKVAIFAFSDPETIESIRRTTLIELPGTYKESVAVQKKYPDAQLFTGYRATKKNFIKAYMDPETEYIHLAVHGIANSSKKEDIKLYFRTSSGGLDSLFGFELLRYKSSVKKIVLSACESGKGRYIEGEGNYTLARYFMINGATEVVSSVHLLADDSWMGNSGVIRYVVR
jgi:CHAT domain-containing protein